MNAKGTGENKQVSRWVNPAGQVATLTAIVATEARHVQHPHGIGRELVAILNREAR